MFQGAGHPPPQVGMCRTRNIRNMVMRSDISKFQEQNERRDTLPMGHFRCRRCKICPIVMEGNNCIQGQEIVKKGFSTCGTEGVVYLIKCTCPLLYVGKTSRTLRTCLLEHRSRIRLKVYEAPMVEHFLSAGHREDEFGHTVLYVGKLKGKRATKRTLEISVPSKVS